jgi:hypothetical protein
MSETMTENEQLERILNSAPLVTSPSLSRFLRYIVDETRAGRSANIREYTLGVHVFDRGEDFNPRLDPIVRVQARNLRARIAKYYEGPGADDPIRIELPKGSYVPVFHKLVVDSHANGSGPAKPEAAAPLPVHTSIMPAPPPRSPVAEPRAVPRFWVAAVILLVILIGIAALLLSRTSDSQRISRSHTVAQIHEAWGILRG